MVSVGRSKTDSSENRENGFGQSALFLDDRIADDGERSPNTSLWCAASFPLPSGFQRHLMRQAVRRVAADWVLVRLRSCFSIRLIYARTHERCQLKISRIAPTKPRPIPRRDVGRCPVRLPIASGPAARPCIAMPRVGISSVRRGRHLSCDVICHAAAADARGCADATT